MADSSTLESGAARGSRGASGPKIMIMLLCALGTVISCLILYLHHKLKVTSGAYTSFCNIGGELNCDRVLTSPYSRLLGYPVELWGLATYLLIATATVTTTLVPERRNQGAMVLVLSLSSWTAIFSIYMGFIATFSVGYLCINCVALYLTNFALAASAWVWIGRAGGIGSRTGSVVSLRQIVYGVAAASLLLAVAAALQQRSSSAMVGYLTLEEVKEQAPDFYNWYTSRPIIAPLPLARHAKGPTDARVRIVEFSDFECGHCRKASHILANLMGKYLGTVRLEFRHYPLDESCNPQVREPFHQLACSCAVATECAGRQGKFWEYHDLLFSGSSMLDGQALLRYAEELGLDQQQFRQCLKDEDVLATVKADIMMGKRLNVHSTPTMFINNRMIVGALEPVGYEYAIAIERNRGKTK